MKEENMMKVKQILGSSMISAAVALSVAAPSAQAAGELIFYSVEPCRILDTRTATEAGLEGPIGTSGDGVTITTNSISFSTNTDTINTDFTAQGGFATDCGIPTEANGDPVAVLVNIIAVNPDYDGHLRVFPSDETALPETSLLNYVPGVNTSNGATVAQFVDGTDTNELSVYTAATADIVVDIAGYYLAAETTTVDTTAAATGVTNVIRILP